MSCVHRKAEIGTTN